MRRALWVAAPLVGCLLLAAVLALAGVDPVLYLSGPLPALLVIAGVLVTVLAGAVIGARELRARDRRRAAADAATAAAADRRRLLMRLDHELKNPLTAIHAGLANVADGADDAARERALDGVGAQATRLTRLMTDLRKLTELETRDVERVPVDLDAMLREVDGAVRELPGASERRLRLTLPEAPWPLPAVRGDVDLLFVAVHNLAVNAVKFTRPGDAIEIRAAEDGDAVMIEVADTGPGIPPEELDEVWEELARGEAARGVPGTGLGLPLVRTIVARHGGEERIRSRVGQGTVVSLRLPALEPSRDRHAP
jgi:two-component system, OmpR family, sensor kinase